MAVLKVVQIEENTKMVYPKITKIHFFLLKMMYHFSLINLNISGKYHFLNRLKKETAISQVLLYIKEYPQLY